MFLCLVRVEGDQRQEKNGKMQKKKSGVLGQGHMWFGEERNKRIIFVVFPVPEALSSFRKESRMSDMSTEARRQ